MKPGSDYRQLASRAQAVNYFLCCLGTILVAFPIAMIKYPDQRKERFILAHSLRA